jgi:hypothetical protein
MHTINLPFATVTKIKNEDLGNVLASLFPEDFLNVEFDHYQVLDSLTNEYRGGLWTGYTNPEHTIFFMVPPGESYTLDVQGNYYHGTMSAEAAGIVTSLMVLNRLVWRTRDPAHNDLFYNLRTWAMDHPEASEIFRAID